MFTFSWLVGGPNIYSLDLCILYRKLYMHSVKLLCLSLDYLHHSNSLEMTLVVSCCVSLCNGSK